MHNSASSDLPLVVDAEAANKNARRQNWPIIYDSSCLFIHSELKELLSVWRSAAGETQVPKRRALTARLLKPFLKQLAIYEHVRGDGGSRRYCVRLMGMSVVKMIGELTGRFLDEVIAGQFVPRWYPMLDVPLLTAAPLRVLARVDSVDKQFVVGENLAAPLCADDGEIKLVLVAVYYDSTHPWTEIAAAECRRLGLAPVCADA
jgi:hypothetical protein